MSQYIDLTLKHVEDKIISMSVLKMIFQIASSALGFHSVMEAERNRNQAALWDPNPRVRVKRIE